VVIDASSGLQAVPQIAALPDGEIAVLYRDTFYADGIGETLRILYPTGERGNRAYTHANTIPVSGDDDPDLTVLANGFIVTTWARPFNDESDILMRVFDQKGHPVTVNGATAEFAVTQKGAAERQPTISALGSGRFVVSWIDDTPDEAGNMSIHSAVSQIYRKVVGNAASDTFVGDQLRDLFTGGGGDDRFVYNPGGGSDTWTDFRAAAVPRTRSTLPRWAPAYTPSRTFLLAPSSRAAKSPSISAAVI
jgi:hypothetical protein